MGTYDCISIPKTGYNSLKGVIFIIPSRASLDRYRAADLMTCDPGVLADLRDVQIDTARPVRERMVSYLQQVGNPYLFKVEGLIVRAVFSPGTGRSLMDALTALMSP